jgi:hypothetical protein
MMLRGPHIVAPTHSFFKVKGSNVIHHRILCLKNLEITTLFHWPSVRSYEGASFAFHHAWFLPPPRVKILN